MQISAREASLIEAFRRLPADTAEQISALAERLAELAQHGRINWSDSWSEEDLQEFRAASIQRLESDDPGEPR